MSALRHVAQMLYWWVIRDGLRAVGLSGFRESEWMHETILFTGRICIISAP